MSVENPTYEEALFSARQTLKHLMKMQAANYLNAHPDRRMQLIIDDLNELPPMLRCGLLAFAIDWLNEHEAKQ